MRKVEFLDTSLRDGEQTPGVNFSIKEKVAIAKQLEKWGISSIEAGFPAASPDSFEAVINGAQKNGNSIALAAIDGIAVAAFEVGDTIRPDSSSAIRKLRERGISIYLASGDNAAVAKRIASEVGIDEKLVLAGASPDMKIEKVKEYVDHLRGLGTLLSSSIHFFLYFYSYFF